MSKILIFIILIVFSLQQNGIPLNLNNSTNLNNSKNINNSSNINNSTIVDNSKNSNNSINDNNSSNANNSVNGNNSTSKDISKNVYNSTNTNNSKNVENPTNVDNSTNNSQNITNSTNLKNSSNANTSSIEDNSNNKENSTNVDNINKENKNANFTRLHFDDCGFTEQCKKGLTCKSYRCITQYEIDHFEDLELGVNNLCNSRKKCPKDKQCIKHRCITHSYENDIRKKKGLNDTSVNLLFAGSIFLNNKAYKSGEKKKNNFNYNHLFSHIRNDIRKADLAIVDQETVFQTNKENFKKRVSNTPPELGDAIAKAGFKLVLHGTIYAFSKEEKGIENTLKFWKNKYSDVCTLGISETKKDSENDYLIFKKNNIKIGIINFSGFPDLIPKEKEYMVNVISKQKIEKFVKKLKNETDFIIVCMNWGDKNSTAPNKNQIKWAKELVARGVNLIIGNHPSYVHPVSYIKSKGKRALVFWSLGHLVSDSKLKNSFLGAMANITISRGKGKGYISDYNLIPIINHKINTTAYSVYKLSDYTQKLGLKMSKKFSLNDTLEECRKIMEPFLC